MRVYPETNPNVKYAKKDMTILYTPKEPSQNLHLGTYLGLVRYNTSSHQLNPTGLYFSELSSLNIECCS